MAKKTRRSARHFPSIYKLKAVTSYLAGGATLIASAIAADVHPSVFRRWIREAKAGTFGPMPSAEVAAPAAPEPPAGELFAHSESEPTSTRRPYTKLGAGAQAEVIAMVVAGEKTRAEAARDFGVAMSTVNNWVKKARQEEQRHAAQRPKVPTIAPAHRFQLDMQAEVKDLKQKLIVAERCIGRLTLQLQALIIATE